MTTAFLFITSAAILRVFAILLLPAYTQAWLALAAACWIAALGLFLFVYAPILVLPRVDGREG